MDSPNSLEMVILSTKALLERPIAFYPALARIAGSAKAGLFLSQACYWSPRGSEGDGWFYKTMDEWKKETCLTRYQQESVRKALKATGVLSEKLKGVPAQLHYRVNWSRLQELLGCASSSLQENYKPVSGKLANRHVRNSQTFKEAETTPKITAETIKPRAKFARAPLPENEQRRRIEARDYRLLKEAEARRESQVGKGPEHTRLNAAIWSEFNRVAIAKAIK